MLNNSFLILNKHKIPAVVWISLSLITLFYPFLSIIRYAFAPDGYTYSWVEGSDHAVFIWTLNAPNVDYLAVRDLEQDVNLFWRADHMVSIFLPYGILGNWLGIPAEIMYIIVVAIWNGLCAYATYRFFQTFLKNDQIAILAFLFAYFGSGISGMILSTKWIWNGVSEGLWYLPIIAKGWIGENHAISHEFSNGNALTTMTIISRVHYMMPRFFGLFSLIKFYEALNIKEKKYRRLALASLYMCLTVFFHPASGFIFMVMLVILAGMLWYRYETESRSSILIAFAILALGFIVSASYWKYYGVMNQNTKDFIATYLQSHHNSDLLSIWLGVFPMLIVCIWILFRKTSQKSFYSLLILSALLATIGLSEFIIQDYSIKLRLTFLILSMILAITTLFWKKSYLFDLSRLRNEKVWILMLMGIWFLASVAIAASPHHDLRKIVYEGGLNFGGATEIIRKTLDLGNMVFAARFKLGIWIPLSGLCAYLIYEYLYEKRYYVIIALFAMMIPSAVLYIGVTSKLGRIPVVEYDAMKFLRSQPNGNVMCDEYTGFFLPNISLKRCFGTSAADPHFRQHRHDANKFWGAASYEEQLPILKEYRIRYIYTSAEEREKIKHPELLVRYDKIYDKGDVQIFVVSDNI